MHDVLKRDDVYSQSKATTMERRDFNINIWQAKPLPEGSQGQKRSYDSYMRQICGADLSMLHGVKEKASDDRAQKKYPKQQIIMFLCLIDE